MLETYSNFWLQGDVSVELANIHRNAKCANGLEKARIKLRATHSVQLDLTRAVFGISTHGINWQT